MTDEKFQRLKAIDAMPQVIDPETLIRELRGIYDALPDNADVSGRALRDLLERLDE